MRQPSQRVISTPEYRPRRMRLAAVGMLLLAAVLVFAGCGGSSSAGGGTSTAKFTLHVFAAASLTEAFNEMKPTFEQAHPGVTVEYNFAGSQQLAQQIGQGADADVFASANKKQMDVVVQSGQVATAAPKTFVRNRVVIITPSDNPGQVTTPQDLAKPGLKVVLADASVPVGTYARDFLTNASKDPSFGADYKDKVLKNVVSNETDVKAVFSKVALGEADAGIVYTSDISTNAEKVKNVAIPDAFNPVAAYPIAVTSVSKHADAAQQFVAFVLGPDGQAVLKKYGFLSPSA